MPCWNILIFEGVVIHGLSFKAHLILLRIRYSQIPFCCIHISKVFFNLLAILLAWDIKLNVNISIIFSLLSADYRLLWRLIWSFMLYLQVLLLLDAETIVGISKKGNKTCVSGHSSVLWCLLLVPVILFLFNFVNLLICSFNKELSWRRLLDDLKGFVIWVSWYLWSWALSLLGSPFYLFVETGRRLQHRIETYRVHRAVLLHLLALFILKLVDSFHRISWLLQFIGAFELSISPLIWVCIVIEAVACPDLAFNHVLVICVYHCLTIFVVDCSLRWFLSILIMWICEIAHQSHVRSRTSFIFWTPDSIPSYGPSPFGIEVLGGLVGFVYFFDDLDLFYG